MSTKSFAPPKIASLAFALLLGVAGVATVETAPPASAATVWNVGPGRTFAAPSAVAALVHDGDTVLIDPGVYRGDVAVWTANDLTLTSNGGSVTLVADGRSAEGKAIWVTRGQRITVDGIHFTGSKVPDQNGAGIRFEGRDLTIRNSTFDHNEDGVLGGIDDAESDIVIEDSRFDSNGFGDGYSHNIYVGAVGTFTLRGSVSANALVGHTVKSRARNNFIEYNIVSGGDSTSYEIDLPDGGNARIVGNVIRQSPTSENTTIVSYGAESGRNSGRTVDIVNNTIVNDTPGRGTAVRNALTGSVRLVNNLLSGAFTAVVNGTGTEMASVRTSTGFVNSSVGDYRLTAASPAINVGVAPPVAVASQPAINVGSEPRPVASTIDVGAFEYAIAGPTATPVAYEPVAPTRLVDTRAGGVGKAIAARTPVRYQVAGAARVPGSASVVAMHVTSVDAGDGFVTVYPCGALPDVSSLNTQSAVSASTNLVVVGLDATGGVCVYSWTPTHIIVDVVGWFGAGAKYGANPLNVPARLIDTRSGTPTRVAAGSSLAIASGYPGAAAVAVNLTAIDASAIGFVTMWPCGVARPTVSQMNPRPGPPAANFAIVPLDSTGKFCLYSDVALDVAVDLAAVFNASGNQGFVPVVPRRVVDTRSNVGFGRMNGVSDSSVSGVLDLLTSASAVMANVTTVDATSEGFVTTWNCTTPRPNVSNVNAPGSAATPNAAWIGLNSPQRVCAYASTPTHLLIDIFGFWGPIYSGPS
jgi:hypothetical protein